MYIKLYLFVMKNIEELVSLDERKYLFKHCRKEMGKDITIDVLDIDKAVIYMREQRLKNGAAPYVVIKPIFENQYKEMRLSATYQRDDKTGLRYGIPLREDNFGTILWRKIRIVETETLRIMDNLEDAKTWTVLRFHPKLKNSPWQQSNPIFEVFDPVRSAGKEIAKANSMKKAFEAIDKLSEKPADMLNFVRYMGEDFSEYTQMKIVNGTLNTLAMQDPIGFLTKFNNPSRAYYHVFHAAYQNGLFTEVPGQGYYYQNNPLGMEIPDVINTLKKDSVLISSIVGEIEEKDDALLSIVKELSEQNK